MLEDLEDKVEKLKALLDDNASREYPIYSLEQVVLINELVREKIGEIEKSQQEEEYNHQDLEQAEGDYLPKDNGIDPAPAEEPY